VSAQKKIAQTDAIFAHVKQTHEQTDSATDTMRISLDTKAAVLIGPFSRGGESRTGTQGCDHDFQPEGKLTPFGIFQPKTGESDLFFTDSKVTSDFMVDCLEKWIEERGEALKDIRKLILDLDNGPENSGQRSQWLLRLVLLARKYKLHLVLVYYPPYHSKYNPIERLWGILENYWRGELLDSEDAVLGYARNMTYKGKHPKVHRMTKQYTKGVKLNKAERKILEGSLEREPGLEKWAIEIPPPAPAPTIP
jgi:hypothetical protein